MTLIEARFKVRHDCLFIDITERYPKTKMFVWCNRIKEVVEVIADNDEVYEGTKGLKKYPKWRNNEESKFNPGGYYD